ncbi:MAG: ABC transporter permease [Candidatus Pacebacteria bacterium]|jgi:ABC-2 type transport system permease protein|nr:ABC transporter permease [Candidatus Paceibacterota bacterium]MDD4994662.1 ABC transporter permease [Candidatus Paceibacterota bacterium]MDD5535431.1 ABC transporter permease [Candidatus Paceibacterota bacterium]
MNKKIKTLYIIWYREVLIYLRNTVKFFTSIFLPILILVFFGTGLKTMFPISILGYDFVQFFFPGVLGLSISIMAISSTMSIVWDREFGFLKEILVSPISRSYIILGKILGATTTALIQGILILSIIPYLGINLNAFLFMKAMLVIFLISYGMAALGIFLASRLKKMESFSIVSQIIIAPMAFLSGAFFPLSNAPSWMIKIANYNPLSYGIDALRWVILSGSLEKSEILTITSHPLLLCITVFLVFNFLITFFSIRIFNKSIY